MNTQRESHYQVTIRETLARRGRIGMDPRWVEAWMRLEHGTLDHLGGTDWDREVETAAQCVLASTRDENEAMARSEGL